MASKPELPPYYYDQFGYYAYVLINGTESDLEKTCDALEKGNISVVKTGASRRPAANGIQYQWYIRVGLGGNPDRKPDRQDVHKVLSKFFGILPISDQLRKAQQALEKAEQMRANALRQIRESQIAREKSEQVLKKIQQERESLEVHLQEEQKAAEQLLDESIKLRHALQDENTALRQQVKALEQELHGTKAWAKQLQEAVEQAKQATPLQLAVEQENKGRERLETFQEILSMLMERVQFVDGSITWLWESPDRDSLLQKIWRINVGDHLKAKRFEETKHHEIPWMEIEMRGVSRIYYAPINGKVHVCVMPKELQKKKGKIASILQRHARNF